jgi:hypothetical protein
MTAAPVRRIAIAGWLLFAVSWITPSLDGHHLGAGGFIATTRFVAWLLSASKPCGTILGLCMIFGWLANLSVFIRWPVWTRVLWIAAPWFAFGVVLTSVPVRPTISQRAAYFLYFYPWAVGIALIHLANIAAARRKPVTGSPQ